MGALRRRIRIVRAAGQVRAVLEDDFHHFRVAVVHDEQQVVDIHSQSLRYPFDLCPASGEALKLLVAKPLSGSFLELLSCTDRLQQCTHQLEMACLAMAITRSESHEKDYELRITDPEGNEPRRATLWLNGNMMLDWHFLEHMITSPGAFSGVDLRGGFREFLKTGQFDNESVEQAMVLRRGIFMSRGRIVKRRDNVSLSLGGCYVFQPGRIEGAKRIYGGQQDFSGHPEQLLLDDGNWLERRPGQIEFTCPLVAAG